MDSLFKFIFYLIIIVIWALNNIKKLEKKENYSPSLPKRPAVPIKKPVQQTSALPSSREGIFDENAEVLQPDISITPYEQQVLQMRREKAKAIRDSKPKKIPVPETVATFEENTQEGDLVAKPKQLIEIKKPSLGLKSTVKEGIIWSIILGSPRARVPFNSKGFPNQR